MVYYPGEEREVAKYCIKVTTNSSKYKAVYLTQKQAKKIENQKTLVQDFSMQLEYRKGETKKTLSLQ